MWGDYIVYAVDIPELHVALCGQAGKATLLRTAHFTKSMKPIIVHNVTPWKIGKAEQMQTILWNCLLPLKYMN